MIYIGADHRGRLTVDELCSFLNDLSLEYEVVGEELSSPEDDYPDFASCVALKVLEDTGNRGILLCGSGQGMVIAANRFRGIRAGLCWDLEEVTLGRSDDDINVLCLPTKIFDLEDAEWKKIIRSFLETEFKDAPKYARRVEKLDRLP
jgi:ribose 5-phosphate isomerase B